MESLVRWKEVDRVHEIEIVVKARKKIPHKSVFSEQQDLQRLL